MKYRVKWTETTRFEAVVELDGTPERDGAEFDDAVEELVCKLDEAAILESAVVDRQIDAVEEFV